MKSTEFITETASVTDYAPKSQGGTRKELLAKYKKSGKSADATAARKAGATQKELAAFRPVKEDASCGGTGSSSIAAGPAQNLLGKPQKRAKKVKEGFADDVLAMAKKISSNAKMRGTTEQQKAERDAVMAKRATAASKLPKPAPKPPLTQDELDQIEFDARGYGKGRYMGDSKNNTGKAVNEEEQIDELSGATLGSYAQKARKDANARLADS